VANFRQENYYQRSERNIGGKKPILRHLHNFLCHSGLDPESRKSLIKLDSRLRGNDEHFQVICFAKALYLGMKLQMKSDQEAGSSLLGKRESDKLVSKAQGNRTTKSSWNFFTANRHFRAV